MGWAFQSAFALCNLAQVTLYLGLWDESRAYAEEALEQPQAATLGFVVRAARMNLGQVALAQGAWNEARDLLQQAEDDSAGPLQMGRYVQAVRATLDIREGRAASAIERLDPLVAQADPDDNDLGAMLPVLALAHVVNGDIEHGRELARRVLDRMPENALARAEAWPALGLALYRQDRHEEAVEAFREGVELAHRIEYPYAEAMSLALWGREARSRELLEEALQIFRRLGARKDIEQTEGLLAGIE
jgi:tetratricopeptide (TPR) repeat protein